MSGALSWRDLHAPPSAPSLSVLSAPMALAWRPLCGHCSRRCDRNSLPENSLCLAVMFIFSFRDPVGPIP